MAGTATAQVVCKDLVVRAPSELAVALGAGPKKDFFQMDVAAARRKAGDKFLAFLARKNMARA